jgi:benzodiazapine receptor
MLLLYRGAVYKPHHLNITVHHLLYLTTMKKIGIFILCILIPLSIGAIGGIATAQGVNTWFLTLNKPIFNPPNYLFGPVWTCLYILMGISFYLMLTSKHTGSRAGAVGIFCIQLLLNFGWSFIFFKFHWLGWALAEIMLLWLAILTMMIIFYKINKVAAYLQIPYLLWVSFATALNAAFYVLN